MLNMYLNVVYELPEDGTDMPKHVTAVKEHTFMYSVIVNRLGFINES